MQQQQLEKKISLRRIAVVEKADDEFFGSYVHMGGKISALVTLKGKADEKSCERHRYAGS